jgi:hypothetical protein
VGPAAAATGSFTTPCYATTSNSHSSNTVRTATFDAGSDDCEWVQGHKLRYFDGWAAVTGTTYGSDNTLHQFSRTGYYLYYSVNRVKNGYIASKSLTCNC